MKIVKVNNLPQTYEADTIYLVKSSTAGLVDIYVTDNIGTQIRSLAVDTAVINSLLPISEVGVSVASLVDGKVPTNQLPSAILGALTYQGTWNASTNNPAIPAASPSNKGWYYVVSTAGTSSIDGVADWEIGDWAVSSGAGWGKIDNSDKVSSVAGKTGVVTLTKSDVGLGNVDNTSDANKPISTATQTALADKQASLGFTPVQQGGGTEQGVNKVFMGWATNASGLRIQVDSTDFGNSWPVSITKNAATATKLATARTINGVSFDGTANITVADSTKLPLTGGTVTGELVSSFANTFRITQGNYGVFWRNDGTNTYLMVTASGDPYGTYTAARPLSVINSSGVASINGNAATATKLATARTINGIAFDGSANISVPVNWSAVTGKPAVIAAGADAATARSAIGAASLVGGKIPEHELPSLAITDVFPVASEAEMLALTAEKGDMAIRSDLNKCFALSAAPASTLANWLELKTPANAVLSVAGRTGAVTLSSSDVGLGNVNNTSDANKPVSTATQTALNLKANLESPALKTPIITGTREKLTAMPANAIDLATGNFFTKTISGSVTFTVTNVPSAGTAASFILELTGAGDATITWFSGVKWAGGVAPTLTSNGGIDVLGFYSHNGGTIWRGMLLAKDSK